MGEEKHTGSCLCGAVAFTVDGPLAPLTACHCNACRKQSGHVWPCTTIWRENFSFQEDRGLKWYHASKESRRGFCGDCGSLLFFDTPGSDGITISGGSFNEPTGQKIGMNIWIDNKGDYYDLETDIPRYHDHEAHDLPMPPKHDPS